MELINWVSYVLWWYVRCLHHMPTQILHVRCAPFVSHNKQISHRNRRNRRPFRVSSSTSWSSLIVSMYMFSFKWHQWQLWTRDSVNTPHAQDEWKSIESRNGLEKMYIYWALLASERARERLPCKIRGRFRLACVLFSCCCCALVAFSSFSLNI